MVLNTYSWYLKIVVVPNTKLESLQPKLEEMWLRFGYPENLILDGGAHTTPWSRKGMSVNLVIKLTLL